MTGIALSALFLGLTFNTAKATNFPSALQCNGVEVFNGDPNFLNLAWYQNMPLRHLDEEPEWEGRFGDIREGETADEVVVDFTSGDQYAFFTFKKSEVEKLKNGEISSLKGVFEDGFDWDHYYVRASIGVRCTIDP